ncbi:hypothetical protein [Frigoribacterium sp. Leaf172]|uniref:hypothetical protein n=1 Tax=Frigoribacterium sp. Leaf172 TaxID=1736285 RepID=UPI0006F2C43A|nr:hypothetical protein [Frigoribacterium sp. Leaf172]KQR64315.1 hypothetical protein ASF89_07140 [Frigoribacterium sp. Leaf172]
MSSQFALVDPTPLLERSPSATPRPVEIVTSRAQRRARPKIVYALVATASLFVLLLAQLAISIALSDGAYRISALQAQQTELTRDQQKYSEQLDVLSSPQNLANNAEELGMVRNSNPVYLDPATGAVHGQPSPADGGADGTDNLIPNTLLDGVPLATAQKPDASATAGAKAPADQGSTSTADASVASTGVAAPVSGSAAAGAASGGSPEQSVASDPNQLAAPQTR